jgi:uncharacterized repeat protein (TIGR03803 family)
MNMKSEFKKRLYRQFKNHLATGSVVLSLGLATSQSPGQSYTILHAFGTNTMGQNPYSQLVQGPDGALYGTTDNGGSANRGQVFKVNPDGSGYTVLKDFTGPDGAWPEAGLVLSGTTLYGTTVNGGTNDNGTVFKVNTDGTGFAVLKQFTGYDGANPYAKLMLLDDLIYGTTGGGGAFGNGTMFKINTDGTGFTVLKHFTGNVDGAWPNASLAASSTTLYGTANGGGSYGNGTVYKINTDGSGFAVLKSFTGASDGGGPAAGLSLSGEILYGTASWGGNSGNGTVFKLNADGSGFTVLKDFADGIEGANPYADLVLSGTTLYGVAGNGGSSGNGTVFKVNTDGSGFAVLKDFTNSIDGAYCSAGLLLSGKTLFGTTSGGGNSGYGTIFKIETDGGGYAVLTNFTGGDGMNPYGSLILSGATFYGTTIGGGATGNGTIFKINADGSGYTTIKSFAGGNGFYPYSALILSGSTLYGTEDYGGTSGMGTVFKLNTDGTGFAVLKDFTNWSEGAMPRSVLVSGSVLYGIASDGGSNSFGIVFKVNSDGSDFTALKHFRGSDGANPYGALLLSGTTLYGITVNGGSSGYGTVFKINTDGSGFTVLKHFTGSDGASPYAGLVLSGTTLFGSTTGGGDSWSGTLFKIDVDGTGFAVLQNFTAATGAGPQGRLLLSGTTLYGTTWWGGLTGNGTVFQVNTDGSHFSVLKHFTGSDGAYSGGGLVLSGTTLYGTTFNGGYTYNGAMFSLSLLLGEPEIQLQPRSQTAQLGWSINFTVIASQIPAPDYQWFFNGTAIDGATNYSLQLDNVQGSQAGGYYVVVTNNYGSVTSLVATLTVQDPFINNPPWSQLVNAGDTVQFSIDAGGTQPLSYQWFKDGVSLGDNDHVSGSQTPVLTLNSVFGNDGGWFFCVVSNVSGSVTSVPAMLVVSDPTINSQPSNQSVNLGDTADFSVDAEGTPPLSYHWFKDGVSLIDQGTISGAQSPTLTLSNVSAGDSGWYLVVISNVVGKVTSVGVTLMANIPPPAQGANLLTNSDFEAGNTGFVSSYYYSPGDLVNEGTYDVVTDPHNSHSGGASFGDHTTGNGLMMALNGSPKPNDVVWGETINVVPGSTYLFSGWTATWGTSGEGTDPSPPVLRILINGQQQGVDDRLNATNGLWQYFSVSWQSQSSTQASIVIYDANTEGGGNDFALDDLQLVRASPFILNTPQTQTSETGSTMPFLVEAGGYPSLYFQWFLNGTNLVSSTTNCDLSLTNIQIPQSGSYVLVVTNIFGAVTSAPVMLQVIPAVEHQPVLGFKMMGEIGGLLNVECTESISPAPNWLPLDVVNLTNPPQYWFDLTKPLPSQRFYRAWQAGTPTVAPSLSLPGMVPAITLTGSIGNSLRLDCINQIGPTDTWETLDTVTLTNTSQLYFDTSAVGQPARLYRIVPAP